MKWMFHHPRSKMAATRSIFRFLGSRHSTSFSALTIGFSNGNIAHQWSRMSNQYTRPVRLLSTHNKQPRIKNYNILWNQSQKSICQKLTLPLTTRTLSTTFIINGRPLLSIPSGNLCFQRGVTLVSKKGKRKTCKAVAKRFIRTGKGKLKRWRCGYHHNQTKKSGRRKRALRKPTYASKTQLKTLNKMLNGW